MSFIGCNWSGTLYVIILFLFALLLQFLCAVLLYRTLVGLSVFDSLSPRLRRGETFNERLFLCGTNIVFSSPRYFGVLNYYLGV